MRQKFCVTFKKLEGGLHCQLACRFILSIVDEYILHTLNNAHNLTKKKKQKRRKPLEPLQQGGYCREKTAETNANDIQRDVFGELYDFNVFSAASKAHSMYTCPACHISC